jgi:DNA-binding XRE family transcriptional regulator
MGMNRKPGDDVRDPHSRHPLVALLTTERIMLGIPRVEVANAAGLSRNTLATVETGKRGPSLHTFDAYARGMGYQLALEPIEKKRRTLKMIKCPVCGVEVRSGTLEAHVVAAHHDDVVPGMRGGR